MSLVQMILSSSFPVVHLPSCSIIILFFKRCQINKQEPRKKRRNSYLVLFCFSLDDNQHCSSAGYIQQENKRKLLGPCQRSNDFTATITPRFSSDPWCSYFLEVVISRQTSKKRGKCICLSWLSMALINTMTKINLGWK